MQTWGLTLGLALSLIRSGFGLLIFSGSSFRFCGFAWFSASLGSAVLLASGSSFGSRLFLLALARRSGSSPWLLALAVGCGSKLRLLLGT